MKKKALKLSLEVFEYPGNIWHMDCPKDKAIIAIRKVLTQPDQEPVAYLDEGLGAFYWAKDYKKHVGFKPLYTTPPQRKPLTDEEIDAIPFRALEIGPTESFREFARAIEAAHGIKE